MSGGLNLLPIVADRDTDLAARGELVPIVTEFLWSQLFLREICPEQLTGPSEARSLEPPRAKRGE